MTRRDLVTRNYLRRQRELRVEMLRRLEALYWANVREDAIRETFDERFTPPAARTVTAAQGAAQTLTRAYLRGIGGGLVTGPLLAGTSESGTIALALTGIVPIILRVIKAGGSAADALQVGAAHVSRTADNELTRVIDAETDLQAASGGYGGWIGHTFGAKDPCVGNEGWHPVDAAIYRHPSCRCVRELVPL